MSRLFILNHPDGEPKYSNTALNSVNIISWNTTRKHYRKFITRGGLYIDKGKCIYNDLYFWGEYEPYSEAKIINTSKPFGLHDVLLPVSSLPTMPQKALNTDPYIFGCFRNVCCQRRAKYVADDVILFGTFTNSTIFELDTVIVVDKLIPFSSLHKNDQYYLASVKPYILTSNNRHKDFVEGKTYNATNLMFSFVPCLTNLTSPISPKPLIDLSKLGDGHSASKGGRSPWVYRNQKMTQNIWDEIVLQVISQGWKLGILIDKI